MAVQARSWALVLGGIGVLGFLGLWQFAAMGPMADTSLPYADSTIRRLVSLLSDQRFWSAVSDTLRTALLGFLISAVLGIGIGLASGLNAYVHAATRLLVDIFKPIPPIVILPLVVYELGPSIRMATFLIVAGLVPSLIIATAAGVRDTDPIALDTAHSFQLGPLQTAKSIVFPSAMPFVVTGLRIAAFASLLIAVMAEIVGGAPGLGSEISRAQRANQPETTYALVLAVGLLGLLLDSAVSLAERRILSWHVSIRGEQDDTDVRATRLAGFRHAFRPISQRLDQMTFRLDRKFAGRGTQRRANHVVIKVLEYGTPLALIAWWWVASANSSDAFFVPLREILVSFRSLWLFDRFTPDVIPSLRNLAFGFAIGSISGIALGLAMGSFRTLRQLLEPLLALFRSIPGVAFIPILITLIGFGTTMRVSTIVLATMFPVIIATVDGVRSVDSLLEDVGRSYQLSTVNKVRFIYLPAASPRIAAGLEIALATALVVMIASELTGVTVGIGAQTILAQQSFQFADMWAGVLLLALLGVVTNWIFRSIERRWLSWYRGATTARKAA